MQTMADSVEGWIKLARLSRQMAEWAASSPETRNAAWSHAGFACECLFKAAIMRKERLNAWPSRDSRRDLYTHDLKALAKILGVKITGDDTIAPAWSVVLQWQREHMYIAQDMPSAVVDGLMEAMFSEEGMARWIFQNFLTGI